MNTYTFKIGIAVNKIVTALNCPLEAFIVSVSKTKELIEADERAHFKVYVEDYLCSSKEYALSAQYCCELSDLINALKPLSEDEEEVKTYERAAKWFSLQIPYLNDSKPITMVEFPEEGDNDE